MIHTKRRLIWTMVTATLYLVSPAAANAQENGANPLMVKHRNDCRLAAQVLITREPHTKRDWARDYISSCPDEGPAAIVQEWRTVPGDTGAVVQLMRASTRIHDRRIYEQARIVAADRSRPDVVRVGAMHVLDNYVAPFHAGWFSAVPPRNGIVERVRPITAVAGHPVYTNGPVPVVGSVAAPVLHLLQQIGAARDTEPVTVWYAAAAIALRIQWGIERSR
jgi:hypothetical protein